MSAMVINLSAHVISVELKDSKQNYFSERNQLSKNKPEFDPLDIRGGRQFVHDIDEQCSDY